MSGLTRKCQYALRALYFLAREYGKGPILIPHISAHANAPAGFLQSILFELKHAGILESQRGAQGGYYLRTPPERLTVGAIVRIIDGPIIMLPCVGEGDARACADCNDSAHACRTRLLMREVQHAIMAILDHAPILAIEPSEVPPVQRESRVSLSN